MIVAEIGLNHFGSTNIASKYVGTLCKSNVDAITFQVANKDFYERQSFNLKLDNFFYEEIIKKVRKNKKKIGIALADINDIEKYDKLDFDFIKILSIGTKKINRKNKIRKCNKRIFLAIGMVNNTELLNLLKYVHNKNNLTILYTYFNKSMKVIDIKKTSNQLKKKFKLPVGYTHHDTSFKKLKKMINSDFSDIFFYVKRNIKKKHFDEDHAINLEKIRLSKSKDIFYE